MNNLESIFEAEKAHEYKIADRDQFFFDTLTALQKEEKKSLKKVLILVGVALSLIVVLAQLLFLKSASFHGALDLVEQLLLEKPYFLAIFNLGIIGLIMLVKRLRYNW